MIVDGRNLVRIACAGRFSLAALVAQNSFPRKLDLVTFTTDALNQDLLALFEFIAHILDAPVSDLRNVQQPVGSREDLNECAKVHNPRDGPKIRLAYLRLSG